MREKKKVHFDWSQYFWTILYNTKYDENGIHYSEINRKRTKRSAQIKSKSKHQCDISLSIIGIISNVVW